MLELSGTAQATLAVEGNVCRIAVAAVDGTNWHARITRIFDDPQAGVTYTVRFRAKADAPRRIFLSGSIDEPDWHGIGLGQDVPLTEAWQDYQYEFQAKDLAAENTIQFSVGDQTGTVWIADFTLTKVNLGPLLSNTGKSAEAEAGYRKALATWQKLGKAPPLLAYFQMALGMAEYRGGHFAAANTALTTAIKAGKDNPQIAGTSAFYRGMSLFKQGKDEEARRLALEAAAKMKPLPQDDKKPLVGGAGHDDLILWLACKERGAAESASRPDRLDADREPKMMDAYVAKKGQEPGVQSTPRAIPARGSCPPLPPMTSFRHGCKGMADLRSSARCDVTPGWPRRPGPAPVRPPMNIGEELRSHSTAHPSAAEREKTSWLDSVNAPSRCLLRRRRVPAHELMIADLVLSFWVWRRFKHRDLISGPASPRSRYADH